MKINKDVVALLERQVIREQNSSNLYMYLASWAHMNDYIGLNAYLIKQGADELNHRNKFIDFLNNYANGISFSNLNGTDNGFTSTEEPGDVAGLLDAVLTHEEKITSSVKEIAAKAIETGETVVLSWLDWVLTEQLEEVQKSQDIISRFVLSTDKGQFDEWISKQ